MPTRPRKNEAGGRQLFPRMLFLCFQRLFFFILSPRFCGMRSLCTRVMMSLGIPWALCSNKCHFYYSPFFNSTQWTLWILNGGCGTRNDHVGHESGCGQVSAARHRSLLVPDDSTLAKSLIPPATTITPWRRTSGWGHSQSTNENAFWETVCCSYQYLHSNIVMIVVLDPCSGMFAQHNIMQK